MRRIAYPVLALLLLTSFAEAAVVFSDPVVVRRIGDKTTWEHRATVTSDGSGDATGTTTMNGFIVAIDTDPSATAPDANWGCTLTKTLSTGAQSGDLLGGSISGNRSATLSQRAYPLAPSGNEIWAKINGTATLTCAAMGASKIATVIVTIEE